MNDEDDRELSVIMNRELIEVASDANQFDICDINCTLMCVDELILAMMYVECTMMMR